MKDLMQELEQERKKWRRNDMIFSIAAVILGVVAAVTVIYL